jgi:hypothetical protein
MSRTDLEQLVYQMSGEMRQLVATNKKMLVNVKQSTTAAQREYDKLAADMGRGFGKASLMAGVAFGAIVGYATKAASDASETANAFQVAFGKLEGQAQQFAQTYSKDVGRALDETQAQMAKTQLILTGVGVSAEAALGMTEAIQRRSVDIGSLWNVEDAVAYQAILSGIAGEAEPLKKFGVALNDAAVKQELLRLGFKGSTDQASEAAKSVARLNIIMRASASADNDAIKTKDGLANQLKRAQAEFRNAAVALGNEFLPAATRAAHVATELLTEFNKMPDSMKLAGLAMLGLVAAAGPVAALASGLSKVIKLAAGARVALLAIPGAGVAAGAAGSLALPAATAAATLSLGGDTPEWSKKDILAARLADEATARKKIAELENKSGSSAERKLKFWKGALASSQAEIQNLRTQERAETRSANRAAQRKKAASGEAGLPSVAPSFGLTPDLMKPVAGDKKKTGKSAAEKAADLADRQADRFNADMARAQDDELRARDSMTRGFEAQARIALDRLKVDEDARDQDLKLAVQKEELTQHQADEIRAAEAKARSAERQAIDQSKSEQLTLEHLRQEQVVAGFDADVLEAQASMSESMLERAAIERRLLALRQVQERKALEQDLALNPNLSEGEKAQQRSGLADAQQAARDLLAKSQTDTLKNSILNAFDAAKGGAGSLADYFGDRLKARLLDRLADFLSKAAMNFAQSQGGGGGGGGGLATFAQAAAQFAGFFAGGGTIPANQWGIVNDGDVEAVRAKPGGGIEVASGKTLRGLGGSAAPKTSQTIVHAPITIQADKSILSTELLSAIEAAKGQAVAASLSVVAVQAKKQAKVAKNRIGGR